MANQVLVAAAMLCVVLSMGAQVNAQAWSPPAPVPYLRGWAPSSTPTYAPAGDPEYAPVGAPVYAPVEAPEFAPIEAPEYAPIEAPEYAPIGAPEYAPIGAPELSPLSAQAPLAFVPSPSITLTYPNLAPGPISA